MIGGEVRHVELEEARDIGLPELLRLSGQAVDKVEAKVREFLAAQRVDSCRDLLGAVAAAEEAQIGLVEALHAHAHAVGRQLRQPSGIVGRHVIGVALDGDLPTLSYRIVPPDGVEEALQLGDAELRGRTAPEVDMLHPCALGQLRAAATELRL